MNHVALRLINVEFSACFPSVFLSVCLSVPVCGRAPFAQRKASFSVVSTGNLRHVYFFFVFSQRNITKRRSFISLSKMWTLTSALIFFHSDRCVSLLNYFDGTSDAFERSSKLTFLPPILITPYFLPIKFTVQFTVFVMAFHLYHLYQ